MAEAHTYGAIDQNHRIAWPRVVRREKRTPDARPGEGHGEQAEHCHPPAESNDFGTGASALGGGCEPEEQHGPPVDLLASSLAQIVREGWQDDRNQAEQEEGVGEDHTEGLSSDDTEVRHEAIVFGRKGNGTGPRHARLTTLLF